ncbi:hypothetical protein MLD38_000722 [Melastoma candidum]|uniref:Uncharacterized protein n=1 Tax=Melastoma candidum TaxID=119954 RepID=A0ACB9SBD5_9MYRT|nr:hypothetical protein MLD38_000722 [Melastoma candidum]
MDNPSIVSLLRSTTNSKSTTTGEKRRSKSPSSSSSGGLLRVFKLFPMLTTGCKMVALLGRSARKNPPLLKDNVTTVTVFGYRKGRVVLAIQEDPHCLPMFVIELPITTSAFQREMASETVRIALESDIRTHRKGLVEEYVWAVYCNGRKVGYSIRRKQMTEDEAHVMQQLRGLSMGVGVLPLAPETDGELTYMRARFERVVGSKDSEALYMINPDGVQGPEFSIFLVRVR